MEAEYGHRVQALRASAGMSQERLAELMRERGYRWSQATVWSVEKGARPIRLSEAVDLAAAFGGPLEMITNGGGELPDAYQAGISAGLSMASEALRRFVEEK